MNSMPKHSILKKLLLIAGGIILGLGLICLVLFYIGRPQKHVTWGITFSSIRATELGFKPQELFSTMADDLHLQKVRIPVYWSELEPEPGKFDFSSIDNLLAETDQRQIEVIIGLGKKQPRWPECHQPKWYNELNNKEQQDQAVLKMLETAVTHLKNHPSVTAWQIENEPYFQYGPDCPPIDSKLYESELAVVKQLDNRPIIATDSGEKGPWITAAQSGAEILGATMYREVYHDKKGKYLTYPLPWWTYNIKAGLVRLMTGANTVIGVELQAEPWLIVSDPAGTVPEEQLKHMNGDIFQDNIAYATKVGFSENYLWGAEWWYWMQAKHGDSSMVNAAKNLFDKK